MTAPDGPLTVLHAPCHAPSVTPQTVRFMLSRGADSVAPSEAYRVREFIGDRPRWRVTMPLEVPGDDFDAIRGKFDCPVLVRRRYPLVGEWTRKVANRSEPRKLAPDRWANGQAYAHDLGVLEHIAMHPHAAIRGMPTNLHRVEEYARSMRILERHITLALEANRLPVITGDLNYPNTDGPPWCPRRMFARLGLKTWAIGVDWVGWHPSLVTVARQTFDRAQTKQDHPWMLLRLEGFR